MLGKMITLMFGVKAAPGPGLPQATSQLQTRIQGEVWLPGAPAYDEARRAWIASVDQQPALIVLARHVNDVCAAVKFAQAQALTVALQATGHAGIQATPESLLLLTRGLDEVRVNAERRTAYVQAGAQWGQVLEKAQAVGLAPLLGTSSGVGAVGYTLGGGVGWLLRKYGLSADSVNAFDVVTAAGTPLRASATENPDLFWALRGGGGGFAIVTGMEIRLYPVTQVYAGSLLYPASMARDLLLRWRDWASAAPDELSTSVVLANFPAAAPPMLRNQSFAIVRGCYCGPIAEGARYVEALRAWRAPLHDHWDAMPFAQADLISRDPKDPLPVRNNGGWLHDLTDAAIDLVVDAAFAESGTPSPFLFNMIIRAGGAVDRVREVESPIGHRRARFIWNSAGFIGTPEQARLTEQKQNALKQALAPALIGAYQNFETGASRQNGAGGMFSTDARQRLAQIKATYDPHNLLAHSVRVGKEK